MAGVRGWGFGPSAALSSASVLQAIQIIIAALILCLSASVLQLHEVHFTGDVVLFLVVVIQVGGAGRSVCVGRMELKCGLVPR